MIRHSTIITLSASLLVSSLSAQASDRARAMRGDTTIVTAPATGRWGPPRAAVEVLRLGGTQQGAPFGMITAFAALPDGGVAVFDAQGENGPVLWVFDTKGQHPRQVGREGAGPGEYRFCSDCLVSNADGSIGFLDNDNRRITTYDRRGVVRSTAPLSGRTGYGLAPQILPGPARSYYARIEITPRPRTAITDAQEFDRYGFVQISEDGRILDTVPPPPSWVTTPVQSLLEPRTLWSPLRDGRIVVGASDRLRLLLQPPRDARGGPLLIQAARTRLRFSDAERKTFRETSEWANRYFRRAGGMQSQLPTALPALKPVFLDFGTDHQGRLFLQLHATAVKAPAAPFGAAPVMGHDGRQIPPRPKAEYMEPPLFAAFEPNGTYLGTVLFPVDAFKLSFANGIAWALQKDADGEDLLVKYALPSAR